MELAVFIASGILSLIFWDITPFLAGCIVSGSFFTTKLFTGYYALKKTKSV